MSLKILLRRNLCKFCKESIRPTTLRRFSTSPYKDTTEGEVGVTEETQYEEVIAAELFENMGQKKKARIDPGTTCALLFPGQGSQYVGMAKSLIKYPNVKDMFDSASEILKFDLLSMCLQGPKTELDKTIHCQPAVVVTALAGVEKLQSETPEVLENCFTTAGYSVGEFAALVFAGALRFEDAIKIINVRATEMQIASDATAGGMITVVGGAKTKFNLACAEAISYCKENLDLEDIICRVSGFLSPNVRTIAGHRAALEYIISNKSNYHIKRAQILPVSGAFHTSLMYPAYRSLKNMLRTMDVQSPLIHVYSNLDGNCYRGPKDIITKLPYQVMRPVMWEQSMHSMFSREQNVNMPHSFELGPGQQLGALLRKCNGKAWSNYLPVDTIDPKKIDDVRDE